MSATYDDLCKKLYKEIYHRLEKGHDGLRFATMETAEAVFNYNNMQLFYQSLTTSDFKAEERLGITKKAFVERIRERKLHTFLAILIFARGDVQAARTFTSKLVAAATWPPAGRGQNLLPADQEWLRQFFGDFVTAQEFFAKQAGFCTVVIRKREEITIRSPEAQRLPYLEEKLLAQGSFGTVFGVKIARGHFLDPSTGMANVGPLPMARKDYRVSGGFRAQDERDVMESILGISRSCENILENFGSIQIGDTYSLFMPLAICDLKAYMTSRDFHPMVPGTTGAKADLVRCAEGLADGLKFLHSEMDGIVCYHMDLKPDNILIFRDMRGGEDREIWKLSDFGMSKVKIRRPLGGGQVKGGERDFNRLFIKRGERPADPSMSLTLNRRGEGTYLAPESISATRSMNTESDVWSLGCVISVLFAYLEGGSRGILDYSEARSHDGYDRFFLPGHFNHPRVHSGVREMHTKLIKQAKERSTAESDAIKAMLRYLEESVFVVDPQSRCTAKDVKDRLASTYERYKALGEPDREDSIVASPYKPDKLRGKEKQKFGAAVLGRLRMKNVAKPQHSNPSTKRVNLYGDVKRYYLSKKEDFKGCEISPDGTLIVLWTEKKIVLYNSTSFSVEDGESLTAGPEYRPETTDGFWKTMSVTREHLIASETGSSFNCYIFDLYHGTAVDANLEKYYRLTLPLPEIHKIAISRHSKRVACVLQSAEDEKSPGSLFYAHISDLIEYSKKPTDFLMVPSMTSSDGISSTSGTSISTTGSPWQLAPLDWPGADVIHLSFPNENNIHMVVRPEITGKSRVHRIPIISLSLDTKSIVSVNIEPRGLDPSSTAELFTAFAPFHKELACAVVTRERRIHMLRNLNRENAFPGLGRDINNYRVLKLMMSSQDDSMFALGTISANHNILLLQVSIPDPGDDFEVREVAQFDGLKYDDSFTVNLSEEAGERHVLVAASVTGTRRTIYRVRLP